jgi:RNA polymerase-binding transcription factor
MVVKKATSAARRSVPQKKAAPTKAVAKKAATKAKVTKMTAPKSATKARATKTTSTRVTKVAPTKPATGAGATTVSTTRSTKSTKSTRARATKVAPTKAATRTAATTVAPTTTRASSTGPARGAEGSRGRGAGSSTGARAQPQRLRVRENEKPWTARELATVRSELEADIVRLQREISVAELDLAGLMRDIGDGAGDDPADAGTATFEREQEISLANNAREVFEQSARALARLLDGSYGICESCGSSIGKNRLLAFPRATLCMTCKSKQERR